MSILVQIIENCLSKDNHIRVNAEQEIHKCCDQNLFQVLFQLCKLIEEENTPDSICIFCGTFIRHIFLIDKYISIWNSFSNEQIEIIKTSLLGGLASEKDSKKKACSFGIAAIATIEILKGWNIIEIICNAAVHQNVNYRITSLKTIQNILDFFGNDKLKPHEKQQILCSLTTDMSINEPTQVIREAILGYKLIIPFIETTIKNEKERNFIIGLLLNLLDPNYINKVSLSEEIQKEILMCFIEMTKKYSLYLQNNFSNIANMTFQYFNCNNMVLSTLSIEIWTTISDYETEIKKNIISSNYIDTLNESIIRAVQEKKYFFYEVEEYTSAKAAIILLSGLAFNGNKKITQRMLKYISECFNNELVVKFSQNNNNMTHNEKIQALIVKENAFLIYRGILFSKKLDPNVILNSLDKILSDLKISSNTPIGISIAYCLSIICKHHFDLINDSQDKYDKLMLDILYLLEFHRSNKGIINCLCLALKHIIKNGIPEYLNKHLANLISILWKIAYDKNSYNKDLNVAKSSMEIIKKIIEFCEETQENKNIIQQFFSDLYTRFQDSLNDNNFKVKEEQISYQNSILSIIQSCGGEYQKVTMDANQITCVFNLINQCLQQRGCIFEEGILAMSSLAFYGWDLFSNINNDVMKYILFALEERKDFQLCFQSLIAADDIIRNVGKNNLIVIPKIVEKVRKILSDQNIPRGLKIKCFYIYSDIFVIEDNSIGDYLNEALQLIIDGMNSSQDPPTEDTDIETIEYLDELRDKIIELLTLIFYFLEKHNQINLFSSYIDGFIKYMSKIVEPEFNPNNDLIAGVCGLLGDLSSYFQSYIKLYFNNNSLKTMFNKLEESDKPEHLAIYNFAYKALENIFSDFN